MAPALLLGHAEAAAGNEDVWVNGAPCAGTPLEAHLEMLQDGALATVVEAHSGSLPASHSFVSVDDDNVILTAIKKSEDKGV